jgi:hypothetical protein
LTRNTRLALQAAIIAVGSLVTLPFSIAAVESAGAGHGTYIFAMLFFPYSMIISAFSGIGTFAIALALAQWART